jgi:hypothetical protein
VPSSQAHAENPRLSLGPWLWSPRVDLCVFVGSATFALGLAAWGRAAGLSALPDWAWVALVLGIDVAHVHSTWFRTYLDREEIARHRVRYWALPVVVYLVSWLVYHAGPLLFWRVLAYLAVFHFIRQQVGWVALYRAKAGSSSAWERFVDEAAIWVATLYPLFVWHVHASEKGFSWFVPGDFLALPLASASGLACGLWLAALSVFFARELWHARLTRKLALGKLLIVGVTAVTWYVGIVANDGDFVFTASNVIPHGVPYIWLLFAYTRERSRRAPSWAPGQVVAGGFLAFAAVLIGCAYFEQLAWDRLAEHDHPWLFGDGPLLSAAWLAWLVPLLGLPQAMHYVLDGLIWRREQSRARPAQLAALGFPSQGEVRERGGLA